MRFAVLIALCGLALASQRPSTRQTDISEQYFRAGREYRYRFDGHISAGLPLPGEQASATRLQTLVRIQPENDRYVRLQLSETRFGTVQKELKQMIPFEKVDEVRVQQEYERVLSLPIRFSYRQGLVSDIEFSHDEQPWSANIKRAVVNMLQVNLAKKGLNEKTQPEWEKEGENDYFLATERTIEGECEVAYTKIQKQEQQQWTKSVDFEKCTVRPEVAYGRRFTEKCPECQKTVSDEKLSSTVMNFNITGDLEQFLIHTVELQSQHSMAVYSEEQQLLLVRVYNKMELVYAGEIQKEIPVIRGERKETLIYNPEWELAEEKFAMTGEEKYLRRIPFWGNRVELINQLTSKLAKQVSEGVEVETTHMLARLVKLLRLATEEDLNTVRRSMTERNYPEKVYALYIDALALAGTKNTIAHLFEKMENKDITPIKAAQLFKVLAEIRVPSEKIADSFWRFCDSARHSALRQSCWLSYGSVLNGLCGQHQDKYISLPENKKMCTRDQKQQYVRRIVEKISQAETRFEKVLFVKVLANAGIDTSIVELQTIIMDTKTETIVRVQAIDALRRLRTVIPKKIQAVLVPVYKNQREIPEIRMNALNILLQTQPESGLLDMIVRGIETERSQQIRAFTYTLLKSYADSTNPCEKTFALRVSKILSVVPEPEMTRLHSISKTMTMFNYMNGASLNFASLFSKDNVLPKELAATIETGFGGYFNKYMAQIGLVQSNLDTVLAQLLQKVEKTGLEKLVVRGKRSAIFRPADMLRSLLETLKINHRSVSQEEPHAMLYLRYKDMDYAFLPIDIDTLPEMFRRVVREGQLDISDFESLLMGPYAAIGAAFFHEHLRTLPTALGMPVYYSAKNPTVGAFTGSIKFELEPKNSERFTGLRMRIVAKPQLASVHVTKVEIMCPVVSSGFKLLHGARLQTPIDAEIQVNWEKKLNIKTTWFMPEEKRHVAHFESRPVMYTREWNTKESRHYPEPKEQTVQLKKNFNTKQFERVYFEKTGLKMTVSGEYPRPYSFFVGENVMDVVFEPISESPKEVITHFTVSSFEPFDLEKPQLFNNFFEKVESKKESELRSYLKELKTEKAYKHRVHFKVETSPKTMEAEMDVHAICDERMRFCRVKMDALRSPIEEEQRQWELKTVVEAVLPESELPLAVSVESRWGAEKKNSVNLRLRGEKEVNQLEEYVLHADYDLTPETKWQLEQLYSLVKVWQMWNIDVQPIENEIRHVLCKITVEPETRRYFNFSLWTPKEIVQLKDIQMPFQIPVNRNTLRVSAPVRSLKHIAKHVEQEQRPECIVKSKEVKTFDSLLYKTPLTTCYSVLAKDCTEKPQFAVLMKKIRGEEKKIKIISPEYEIVMERSDDKMIVLVNGKQIEELDWEEYGITKKIGEMYKIDIESVVVYFDGFKAEIKMSPLYKNRQCGLCGHFDGEKQNEFRRADNEETEDMEEFHRSFLVKDDECRVEESEVSEKRNYKVLSNEEQYTSQEEPSEPVMRTRVLERGQKLCFSVEPVKMCPRYTKEEKTTQETVSFKCLRRSEPLAQRLMRLARQEVVSEEMYSELEESDFANYERELRVPRMCSVY